MKTVLSFLTLLLAIALSVVFYGYGVAQEAPVGSIYGVATMKESGQPLDKVYLIVAPVKSSDEMGTRSMRTNPQGRYSIRNLAVGSYYVSANSRAHHMVRKVIEIKEGQRLDVNAVMVPNEPYLNVDANQHVYAPNATPLIQLSGFVRTPNLNLSVTRLDPAKIAKEGGLTEAIEPLNANGRTVEPSSVGVAAVPMQSVKLKKDVEGVFHQRLTMAPLTEGLYWVEVGSGAVHEGTYLNVTKLALVTKYTDERALTYCVDIDTGVPISGVSLSTSNGKGLQPAATSDAHGLAEIALAKSKGSVIVARQGASVAICDRGNSGQGGGGDSDSDSEGPDTIFIYTDRSIYRPGDTIQFKGIIRRLAGLDYKLPPTGPVTVSFKDAEDNVIGVSHLHAGAKGTFHGSFTTSKEAAPSDCHIEAEFGKSTGRVLVPVEVYRKPDFSVTIRPDSSYCILGELGHATIDCEYYFGGPVVGAKVQVSIYRSAIWDNGDDDDSDSEASSEQGFQGGEYSESYKLVTDANGQAKITFPTRADGDPDAFPEDYKYTITADVGDEGDHYFSGTADVKVLRGDVDLSLDTNQYVADKGDVVHLRGVVKSSDDGKPIAGSDVELDVGHEKWVKDVSKYVLLDTLHATTDASGIAEFTLPITKEGSLSLHGIVHDRKGRTVRSNQFIYVSGDDEFSQEPSQEITATLDKKRYGVGDRAKLLVRTDSPGGSALVTVEVDSILSKQVVPLNQTSTILTLPLTMEMAPNAFISVSYIRKSMYMEASKQVVVDRHDRDLQVTVTPDRPTAQPGQTVTFAIDTRNAAGKPVSADTSLAVVDESLFAVRHDFTNIRRSFYPHRQNGVQTTYSFPEVYLDGGDKGNGQLPIRSKFRDTAAWEPDVQTDSSGHASVKVTLPDNLTQWRATAVACTDIAEVGMSKADIVARKDLMVRIQPPTYMVAGDSQNIAVVVTNDTGHDADVSLNIQLAGVKTDTSIPHSLHVVSGKPATLDLNIQAAVSGEATMTASARLPNGSGDAVRMTLPIVPHGRDEFDDQAGDTDSLAKLDFVRLADADPHVGNLEIALSPSIASGMLRSANSLIGFPYGCVEQTMSRFLPSVLVVKAIEKAGLPPPESASKLPEIASDTFTRLARMQHKDGGWGWWEHDTNSLFMTALVLDGLKRAAEAGYPTPTTIDLKKAIHWGADRLTTGRQKDDLQLDQLYLAFALARYGRTDIAKAELKAMDSKKLSDSEFAFAALAEGACGGNAGSYLNLLRKRVKGISSATHWSTSQGDWLWGNEPTALVLVAFTTLAPKDPLIPSTVRFLMARRRGEGWATTRETAYSLIGLTKYLEGIHEEPSPFTATVKVNGRVVRTVQLNPREMEAPDSVIDIPISALNSGKNRVEISRTGVGKLYYTAHFHQVATAANLAPTAGNMGFAVIRRYYVMESRRLPDGTLSLVPSEKTVDTVKSGGIIRCEIEVISTTPREYVQIECPSPSNCHIAERTDDEYFDEWSWWWSSTVIRDDRIAFFSTYLPKGSSKITYVMRAESPGLSRALPVTVRNMYDEAQRVDSSETPLTVTP